VGQDDPVVRVLWTRAELIALREAIEVTPNFEGRQDAREMLRIAVRAPRVGALELDAQLAEKLGGRIVPVDLATATARAKLLRALHGPDRRRTVPERWRTAPAPGKPVDAIPSAQALHPDEPWARAAAPAGARGADGGNDRAVVDQAHGSPDA
jgi:hypothetical protein